MQGPATVTPCKCECGVNFSCGAGWSRWPDKLQPHPCLQGAVLSLLECSPGWPSTSVVWRRTRECDFMVMVCITHSKTITHGPHYWRLSKSALPQRCIKCVHVRTRAQSKCITVNQFMKWGASCSTAIHGANISYHPRGFWNQISSENIITNAVHLMEIFHTEAIKCFSFHVSLKSVCAGSLNHIKVMCIMCIIYSLWNCIREQFFLDFFF